MKVVTAYNNFARGKIDHDMMGRFDLPIYQSATDLMENFFTNFKGNTIFRSGFEDVLGEAFQDCVFAEFRFRDDQNYLMVFYNTKIRFLSYDSNGNFGWVLSSGTPLEVTTPYTLAQCRELQLTQNSDVVVITHQSHPPKDLTRVSATSFTIANHTFTPSDPFGSSQYPKCCLFYKGRLYFGNTQSKPTTVWGSEAGDYNEFTIPATVTDISPLQFTLSDIAQPIEWLFGGDNSLIAGVTDGIVAINGGGVGSPIKADTIEANLTSADGSNGSIPFKKDGLVFYVGKNDRNMYYFSYDLLTESFLAQDANFVSYDITKGGIGKIRHKKDRDDLIYGVRGDGQLLTLNFKEKENIIGWHTQKTNGFVKDIAVITDNEGNPQLFALTMRGTDYYIERMADHIEFSRRVDFFTGDKSADDEAYNRKVAEEFLQCIYLDNALKVSNLQEDNTITYDSGAGTIEDTDGIFVLGDVGKHISYKTETGYESGRFEITEYIDANTVSVDVLQTPTSNTYDNWYLSFKTLSGLSKYNGKTIGVVTDGGYLSDFTVSGGQIDLGSQVLSVVLGYRYKGIIKSFCLGFQAGAENTQTTMKAITRVGLRCVSSAGGLFGSSLYHLEPVQELSQSDLNYLPPIPIDGTKYISYGDDNEIDKYFYIVQDLPLPLTITSVMIDANYSTTR
jgi:hypothetical protein